MKRDGTDDLAYKFKVSKVVFCVSEIPPRWPRTMGKEWESPLNECFQVGKSFFKSTTNTSSDVGPDVRCPLPMGDPWCLGDFNFQDRALIKGVRSPLAHPLEPSMHAFKGNSVSCKED